MRILRIYSLNNFYGKGIHKIVLILFIMLYITSLILVFLVTRSFYLLTIFIQFFLLYLLPVINSNLISFSICLFVEVQFTYNTMLVPGHSDWIYLYTPLQYSCWKIPWTEEPGRLQSMGSLRVGHDWATSLSLFTFMDWRRKWQPTPVFLPGESQGWGSLVGCCLWGRTESDTTETT